MAEREKGVASTACPSCGNELNPVEQPDGATAYETCHTCYPTTEPTPEPEKASSRQPSREAGTTVEAPASTGEEGN